MSDYENLMCHASEIVSAIEKAGDERLTKREYIAVRMMQTILTGASATPKLLAPMLQLASACAVKVADALIAELAKPTDG